MDERGEHLPANEIGDLYCRSRVSDRPFEYHGDEEKTAGLTLSRAYSRSGDIGFVDDEGYIHLADRRSNMIISGGVNIYPAEIEQVLQEHPAVGDVGVFGIPNEEWGESVKAAIELRDGFDASPEWQQRFSSSRGVISLATRVPRSIDFEESLPRHPSGKLYIRRLRDRYWADQAKQI